MDNPTYTPEQIAQVLEEAVSLVRVSGGKKTPGVLNRLALIEIIEQLQGTIERRNATYRQPDNGWVCFFCGERFLDYDSAKKHFGEEPDEVVRLRKNVTHLSDLLAAVDDVFKTDKKKQQRRIEEMERVLIALIKSVDLQSHYAKLLNDYDGGKRLTFNSADAWIQRLNTLDDKENKNV